VILWKKYPQEWKASTTEWKARKLKIRNKYVQKNVGEEPTTMKNHLERFDYVKRRPIKASLRKMDQMDENPTKWVEKIRKYLEKL